MEVKLQFTSPENEAYLRLISKVPKTRTEIKLNLTTDAGSWIYTRVKFSLYPVRQSSGTVLVFPPNNGVSDNQRYFLYFRVEDQIQINRYLEASFHTFYLNYFVIGRKRKLSNHNIISSFIELLKLTKTKSLYEKLSKFEYRERARIEIFFTKQFLDVHL